MATPISLVAVDVDVARGWLDAVEAALVARAMKQVVPPLALTPVQAAAGRAAVAAKFLAVGTPRTLGLVGAGERAPGILAAQCAYAAPRELRVYEAEATVADEVARALAGPRLTTRATSLREACACDIVVALGPVTIRREWIRGGTLVTVLDGAVELDPTLLAAAMVYATDLGTTAPGRLVHASLAAVAAGLVDGRALDEITILLA